MSRSFSVAAPEQQLQRLFLGELAPFPQPLQPMPCDPKSVLAMYCAQQGVNAFDKGPDNTVMWCTRAFPGMVSSST